MVWTWLRCGGRTSFPNGVSVTDDRICRFPSCAIKLELGSAADRFHKGHIRWCPASQIVGQYDLTALRMSSADFVRLKGFGFWLRLSMRARISASGCLVEAWTPRCSRFRAGSANRRSTRLIREAGVGVKRTCRCGRLAGRAPTAAVLRTAWLSMTMRTSDPSGTRASIPFGKSGHSSDRRRLRHLPMTKPTATSGAANGGVVPLRLRSRVRRSGMPGRSGGTGRVRPGTRIRSSHRRRAPPPVPAATVKALRCRGPCPRMRDRRRV